MLIPEHRNLLHRVARQSVETGLHTGKPLECSLGDYPEALQQPAASFVTLHHHGQLRGCIGTLQARRPMVEDVSHNAFNAAFRDFRFSPLSDDELPGLTFHISILGPTEAMIFEDRQDLISQLQPGIDGLVLSSHGHRGTFLPAVWQSLPEPEKFIEHLLLKAGLSSNYWSDDIQVERYRVEEF